VNLRDIASKVKGYIQSKTQDDEGWIRQGNFAPKQQVQSIFQSQPVQNFTTGLKQSPVYQFGQTLGQSAASPFVNRTLQQNTQQYSSNISKALQMANQAKTPEEKQRWLNLAKSSQSLSGQGSSNVLQQYNKTPLKIAGEGLGTAASLVGGAKLTPKNALIMSGLSGGINKLSGGSFAQGLGTGLAYSPVYAGVAQATNPLLSKFVNFTPVKAQTAGRLMSGLSNVGQGVVSDISTGQKTTPLSAGIDFGVGVLGGKGQFETGGIKVKGFSMDNLTKDELVRAEDMLNNPTKYITETYNASLKNKGIEQKAQIKKIQEEAFDVIDRLAGKYLPNNVYTKSVGNPKQQIKLLVDLSGQNKLGNIQMGIYGGEQAQGYKPNMEGQFSNMADKKVRFEIDDSKAKLNNDLIIKGSKKTLKLSDVLSHDNLFKEYPNFKNIKVKLDESQLFRNADYNPDNKTITIGTNGYFGVGVHPDLLKRTILHEVQHIAQVTENFARGGSPNIFTTTGDLNFLKKQSSIFEDMVNKITEAKNKGIESVSVKELNGNLYNVKNTEYDDIINWAKGQQKSAKENFNSLSSNPTYDNRMDAYKRLTGEIESRDVERRMNLTPEQRARTQPYVSQGIPQNEWITKFDDNTSLSSPIKTGELSPLSPESVSPIKTDDLVKQKAIELYKQKVSDFRIIDGVSKAGTKVKILEAQNPDGTWFNWQQRGGDNAEKELKDIIDRALENRQDMSRIDSPTFMEEAKRLLDSEYNTKQITTELNNSQIKSEYYKEQYAKRKFLNNPTQENSKNWDETLKQNKIKANERISNISPIKTGEVSPLSPESKGIKVKPNDDLVTKFDETIKVGEQPKIKVSQSNKLPWEEKGYDFGEAIYGGNKPPRHPKSDSIRVTGEEADTAMNFAELKASEDPKAFNNIFSNWIGKRESSKTKATVEASKFTNIPGNPEDIIKSVEGGKVNLTPEQQTYSAELRKTYDNLFNEAKKEGVDMNYLENYLTHIWDKPLNQVAQDYKTARQTFGFGGERQLPTYEQGIKMGLKPKYTNPAQILEDYTRRLNETFANMELFKNLKNEGLIVGGSKVSGNPNFAPINAPGFPRAKFNIGEQGSVISNWYAPKDIANQINKIFTPQDYGTIGKIAKAGANLSGKVQDITLSGGIPKTPVNAWTIAQTTKEVLSGRIKSPLTSIFRSLSEKSSNKFFQENAGQIVKMQENNVPMNTSFNVENLIDKGTAKNLFGDNIGSAWNKIVNEPTFKRFMPQLQINLFNDIEKSLLKKGVSSTDATKQAAQAVKNFYGLVDTSNMAKRDKLGQNIISSVFFAPRYRESMINFWVNNLKGLKNPISPENITNTKFTIGAIISFVAMNAINKANTGNNMWENPSGKEDKMLIKTKDGYIGLPFLSSIATMPRLAARAVMHSIQGDFPEVTKDIKGTLSSAIRPVVDVFNNEDYFGGEIYDPDKSSKWGDIGLYLAGQYNHPYIREIMNTVARDLSPEVKKKLGLTKDSVPAYQTFSKAMELPFRFYNNKVNKGGTGTTDVLETARYYESKDEATKELSSDQKKLYDAMEQKRPDDISQASDIQMNMAEALQLLANPAILRAKAKTAIDTATKTGQALDPFYTLDKDQQLVVLRLKTFYPGDKEKTNITNENIDWLKPYWTARSAYFDELETKGVIAKQEESEEFATPEMQKKLDYYYTLPYGTGARTAYINQNPDLVEYWDKKRAITNEKRAELGLTEQAGFTAYAKEPKKLTAKITKYESPKANIKFSSPRASKFKLKPSPKIKITKTDNRKYTIKA